MEHRRKSATTQVIEELRLKKAKGKKCIHSQLASIKVRFPQSPMGQRQFSRKDLERACRRLNQARGTSSSVSLTNSPNKPLRYTNNSTMPLGERHQRSHVSSPSSYPLHVKITGKNGISQIRSFDNRVKLCARKYNDCKAQSDVIDKELQIKLDELASLKRESAALDRMVAGENPEAMQLSALAKEIADANAGAYAKNRFRLQLNHMHRRICKNSVWLDGHISAISDALERARKEQEECEKMLGEVEVGLLDGMMALETSVQSVGDEKERRRCALGMKRIDVKSSRRLENWRVKRESSRQNLEKSLYGTCSQEQGLLSERIRNRQKNVKRINREVEFTNNECCSIEEALNMLKNGTGINSLEAIIGKFGGQQNHCKKLQSEKEIAEDRLYLALNDLQTANDMKTSNQINGLGNTNCNRGVLAHMNGAITAEQTQGNIVRSTNVRVEGVLVVLRQGSMGLYQKLLPFYATTQDGHTPVLGKNSSYSAIQAAFETLEILKIAALVLGNMLRAVGGIDHVIEELSRGGSFCTAGELKANGPSIGKLENPNLGNFNCRVGANNSPRPN